VDPLLLANANREFIAVCDGGGMTFRAGHLYGAVV
jgi:hypothetical protein